MSQVLIQVGFPKTGSTYLQEWFRQHPSFYYNGKSVAGFKNSWEIESYARDPENNHECFVVKVSAFGLRNLQEKAGVNVADDEIDNYRQKLSETVYKLFPQGKVLIVTRGFASMLASLYSEYVVSGGILSFEKFWEQYSGGILQAYDYNRLIRIFQERFGKENVLVFPYELLRDDPQGYISQLEAKIGVSQRFQLPEMKINASPGNAYLEANLKVSNLVFKLLKPFPHRWQKNLYGLYILKIAKKKDLFLMRTLARRIKQTQDLAAGEERTRLFAGKAEILRNELLYQSYLKEYLLD